MRNFAKFFDINRFGNFSGKSVFANGRSQRIAQLHIHVYRSTLLRALPDSFKRNGTRFFKRSRRKRRNAILFPNGKMRENSLLRDCLPRVAILKFGRTVGRDNNQRRTGHPRFHNGGKVICKRRSRGTNQHHRAHRAFCQAERKKSGRTLVQHRNRFQTANFRRCRRQRGRTRSGRNHSRTHAAIFQRLHKNRAPKRICISEIHPKHSDVHNPKRQRN